MTCDFLLYGSYGYTGRLVARRAVERGLRPLLAGRDGEALGAQAREMGLPCRAFPVEDAVGLEAALGEVPLVLHCAGPFRHTFRPVAEACLRTRRHYLDITGEIGVFEELAGLGDVAERAGVMLLPGVGFDVVPTDCLAAHLKRRLPSATRLRLAFQARRGGVSRGTARTMVERLGEGGMVRKRGGLVRVPLAWKARQVDFGDGPVAATTIPWGDVSTAWYSTGIGDVEVYVAVSPAALWLMRLGRGLEPLLASGPARRLLRRWIGRRPAGPSDAQRARGEARVWGEVEDDAGGRAAARVRTPEGYTLTARASVAAAERVLRGEAPAGFQTPSLAYGPDFVLELEGVVREDVEDVAREGVEKVAEEIVEAETEG